MSVAPPTSPTPDAPVQVDVLLVTVTDVETRAVFDVLWELYGHSTVHHHIDQKIYYDLGTIDGARVWLVCSEMGVVSRGGALSTIANAINGLQPKAILMVGIAFGINPNKQKIGDVLVARQLMLYDLQRIGTSATGEVIVHPRGDRAAVSEVLLDRVRHSTRTWSPASAPSGTPRVQVGLVFSGDKLLDNQSFRGQLLQFEPEAIGGEMEGAGLYLAASARHIDWILIKAICDWADGNKGHNKHDNQLLAARNAALFTFHMLGQGGFASVPRTNSHLTQPAMPNPTAEQTSSGSANSDSPGAAARTSITNSAKNVSGGTVTQSGRDVIHHGLQGDDLAAVLKALTGQRSEGK